MKVWRCWVVACDAQAWTALGTWFAGIVVLWYAIETQRLRKIADDQLEAQIAPMLMPKSGRASREEQHNCAGRFDRTWGKPGIEIHISNEGKGVALEGVLGVRVIGGKHLDIEYDLSAVPAGKFITLSVAREDFFGDASTETADRSFQVRLVAEYQSLARKRYRSRVKVLGWDQYGESEDQSNLEYERCDEAKRNRRKRLRDIARAGGRVCSMCGDEIHKPTPLEKIKLQRKIAKTLAGASDVDRAPRWRLGFRKYVLITVCPDCKSKVDGVVQLASAGEAMGGKR